MSAQPTHAPAPTTPPARTHSEASVLLRRPFAPGAIGFRAMTKVPYGTNPYGGAQVAAYLNAHSVTQRLNAVVPGRWRQEFHPVAPELIPSSGGNQRKLYLACRLTITLPVEEGADPVDAVYEDVGEMDTGSFASLKALHSDARKRAAVAAGIGAYLYTALAPVVLPIGPEFKQVRAIRRPGKKDLLELSAQTEQWVRHGYAARMATEAVRRDLGDILTHGEPEEGMGQGEGMEPGAPEPSTNPATTATPEDGAPGQDNGVVVVDFGGVGPADAA